MKNLFNLKRLLLFFAAATITVSACKKNSPKITKPPAVIDTSVYIAGNVGYYEGVAHQIAAYWKNGVVTVIGDTSEASVALGIFVKGNDVYAAGYTLNLTNEDFNAVYWKNGVKHILPGIKNAGASGITMLGDDVYIVGSGLDTLKHNQAVYWKNGVEVPLGDPSVTTTATGVTVSNNKVYIVGTYLDNIGVYWTGGNIFSIDNTALMGGIAVSGTDIYTVGTRNNHPISWKNKTVMNLTASGYTGPGQGTGIAVKGNDVYATGNLGGTPFYWKNGTPTILSDTSGAAVANAIAVNSHNDVYVAGYTLSPNYSYTKVGNVWVLAVIATCWKNGIPTTLEDGIGGQTYGIFIAQN